MGRTYRSETELKRDLYNLLVRWNTDNKFRESLKQGGSYEAKPLFFWIGLLINYSPRFYEHYRNTLGAKYTETKESRIKQLLKKESDSFDLFMQKCYESTGIREQIRYESEWTNQLTPEQLQQLNQYSQLADNTQKEDLFDKLLNSILEKKDKKKKTQEEPPPPPQTGLVHPTTGQPLSSQPLPPQTPPQLVHPTTGQPLSSKPLPPQKPLQLISSTGSPLSSKPQKVQPPQLISSSGTPLLTPKKAPPPPPPQLISSVDGRILTTQKQPPTPSPVLVNSQGQVITSKKSGILKLLDKVKYSFARFGPVLKKQLAKRPLVTSSVISGFFGGLIGGVQGGTTGGLIGGILGTSFPPMVKMGLGRWILSFIEGNPGSDNTNYTSSESSLPRSNFNPLNFKRLGFGRGIVGGAGKKVAARLFLMNPWVGAIIGIILLFIIILIPLGLLNNTALLPPWGTEIGSGGNLPPPASCTANNLDSYIKTHGFVPATEKIKGNLVTNIDFITAKEKAIKWSTFLKEEKGIEVDPVLPVWWAFFETGEINDSFHYSNCLDNDYNVNTNCSEFDSGKWQLGYGQQYADTAWKIKEAFTDIYGDPGSADKTRLVGQNVLNNAGQDKIFPAKSLTDLIKEAGEKNIAQSRYWVSVLTRDQDISMYLLTHIFSAYTNFWQQAASWGSYYQNEATIQRASNILNDILTAWGGTKDCQKKTSPVENFIFYCQSNPTYQTTCDGIDNDLAVSGCGPTTMAMILSSFGEVVTPDAMNKIFRDRGWKQCGEASSMITAINTYLGQERGFAVIALKIEDAVPNLEEMKKKLDEGYLIIGSTVTHIFAVDGIDLKNRTIHIQDPDSGCIEDESTRDYIAVQKPWGGEDWYYAFAIKKIEGE